MDLVDKRGDPMVIPFIYEIEGDTLRLVMPLPDPAVKGEPKRPAGFDTDGKMLIKITARRVKE